MESDLQIIKELELIELGLAQRPHFESHLFDPFLRRLETPKGMTYKWLAVANFNHYAPHKLKEWKEHELGGWRFVPHSRHPEMPGMNGYIFHKNNLLIEHDHQLEIAGEVKYTWEERALRKMMGLDKDKDKDKEDEILSNIREEKEVKSPCWDHIPQEHKDGLAKYCTFGEIRVLDDNKIYDDEIKTFPDPDNIIESVERYTFGGADGKPSEPWDFLIDKMTVTSTERLDYCSDGHFMKLIEQADRNNITNTNSPFGIKLNNPCKVIDENLSEKDKSIVFEDEFIIGMHKGSLGCKLHEEGQPLFSCAHPHYSTDIETAERLELSELNEDSLETVEAEIVDGRIIFPRE